MSNIAKSETIFKGAGDRLKTWWYARWEALAMGLLVALAVAAVFGVWRLYMEMPQKEPVRFEVGGLR